MAQCRGNTVKPTAKRQVFISAYTVKQRQARAYLRTAAFKQARPLRPGIERVIACLVCYNGACRATGDGLVNANYQARLAAMGPISTLGHLANRQTPPPPSAP